MSYYHRMRWRFSCVSARYSGIWLRHTPCRRQDNNSERVSSASIMQFCHHTADTLAKGCHNTSSLISMTTMTSSGSTMPVAQTHTIQCDANHVSNSSNLRPAAVRQFPTPPKSPATKLISFSMIHKSARQIEHYGVHNHTQLPSPNGSCYCSTCRKLHSSTPKWPHTTSCCTRGTNARHQHHRAGTWEDFTPRPARPGGSYAASYLERTSCFLRC